MVIDGTSNATSKASLCLVVASDAASKAVDLFNNGIDNDNVPPPINAIKGHCRRDDISISICKNKRNEGIAKRSAMLVTPPLAMRQWTMTVQP